MNLEEVIRDYLPQIVHMSLGTSKDNKPWVCEVHFVYDDDLNIYFRSLTSRRHSQEIAENPHVAGNIVKQHALGEPVRGIYFEGTAKKLDAGAEQDTAFKLMQEQLKAPDSFFEEAQRPNGHQFYKISVETFYIFGNLDNQGNNKYELKWAQV
jgi:uncharacterized protein YhbP (UPF0306 family)